jgi:hypothetical protein
VLLPTNIGGSGGTGTGGSGGSGSGSSGSSGTGDTAAGGSSGGTTPPTVDSNAPTILVGAPLQIIEAPRIPIAESISPQPNTEGLDIESNMSGTTEGRENLRIGEFNAGLSQRVSRLFVEQWTAQRKSDERELLRSHEEITLPGANWSDDQHDREDTHDRLSVSLNMETIVTSVLGTGVILWAVQASQLAATFITAAVPTWMHVDITSTVDNLAKEKNARDEASVKIFE